MRKSQRVFRYLWRINAIVIFIAATLIAVGVGFLLVEELGRSARHISEKVIPGKDSNQERLPSLGGFSEVTGTKGTLRAELRIQYETGGFSSGDRVETRNILFIAPGDKIARWLLPDNDHVISKDDDILESPVSSAARTIATTALVRSEPSNDATARLILFDPPGRRVLEISEKVSEIHLSSSSEGKITILFARNERVVRVTVDAASFTKVQEDEIEIPDLKSKAPEKSR